MKLIIGQKAMMTDREKAFMVLGKASWNEEKIKHGSELFGVSETLINSCYREMAQLFSEKCGELAGNIRSTKEGSNATS